MWNDPQQLNHGSDSHVIFWKDGPAVTVPDRKEKENIMTLGDQSGGGKCIRRREQDFI